MSLPPVGNNLPRVVAAASGVLTRDEADGVYVAQADHPLYAQRAMLTYTDTTAKNLFTLPAGAQIVDFKIHVKTAFDAGSSNVVDLGDGTTANRFVNDAALGTPGLTLVAPADDAVLSAATVIRGVYVPGGTPATAGVGTITVDYIL